MRLAVWLLILPVRVIRRFAFFFAVSALILSLALNIAVLSISSVHAVASAALSAVGVTTVAAREAGEKLARRKAARDIGRKTANRVTQRMQRGAVRNIASVGGEAIPVVGIAVIAGALVLEVKDACDTAADMAGLKAALMGGGDLEEVRSEAVEHFDCATILPNYNDLPSHEDILNIVKSSPKAAWDAAASNYARLGGFEWPTKFDTATNSVSDWVATVLSYEAWHHWWAEGAMQE